MPPGVVFGPYGPGKDDSLSILETFKLLITDDMCDRIVEMTNKYADTVYRAHRVVFRDDKTWSPLKLLFVVGVPHGAESVVTFVTSFGSNVRNEASSSKS